MKKLPLAKKELGQHFLKNQKVISGITQDHKDSCDVIVEVGPGPGVLTHELAKHSLPLYLIEKDNSFLPYLEKTTPLTHIFFQDALEFRWKDFIEKNKLQNKKIWLVSNLPYNISSLLFIQFLQIPQIQYMTLMFQKEVGEKTYLRETKNQMNGLLFLALNYFHSKMLFKVAPGSFVPPPKVDSIVVSYQRRMNPQVPLNEFSHLNQFSRQVFSQKRKQLGPVLKKYYSKERVYDFFKDLSIPASSRSESLTQEELTQLYLKVRESDEALII